MLMLANPPAAQRHAALAALWQAYALNPDHPAVQGMVSELSGEVLTPSSLAEALGGVNATRRLAHVKERTRRLILQRRQLLQACVQHEASTPAGLDAWLRYGHHFWRSKWLLAAVSVLGLLEIAFADGRPEEQRKQPDARARVQKFKARINSRPRGSHYYQE